MKIEPDLCRVDDALEILVGKVENPLILLHLMKEGTQRFSELKRSLASYHTKNADEAVTGIGRRRYCRTQSVRTSTA